MEFPLLSLNPTILEKVINKTNSSYILLQQTCKDMAEFIRNSPNISVRSGLELELVNGHQFQLLIRSFTVPIDIDSLYGVRLFSLTLPAGTVWGFHNLYNCVKECRISCDYVNIRDGKWTTAQYVKLLNILKRNLNVVYLYGQKRNAFEALFQVKSLKSVYVLDVHPEEAVPTVKRLLPSFESVSVRQKEEDNINLQPFYSVLRILCTEQFPNLCEFMFSGDLPIWGDTDSFKEDVEKTLGDLDMKATAKKEFGEYEFTVLIPLRHTPGRIEGGSTTTATMFLKPGLILYYRDYEE